MASLYDIKTSVVIPNDKTFLGNSSDSLKNCALEVKKLLIDTKNGDLYFPEYNILECLSFP